MAVESVEVDAARYLRIRDVLRIVPIGRSTLFRLADHGKFPKPAKFGAVAVWKEAEIKEWIDQRFAER